MSSSGAPPPFMGRSFVVFIPLLPILEMERCEKLLRCLPPGDPAVPARGPGLLLLLRDDDLRLFVGAVLSLWTGEPKLVVARIGMLTDCLEKEEGDENPLFDLPLGEREEDEPLLL